jgi:hypothetical protein
VWLWRIRKFESWDIIIEAISVGGVREGYEEL